MSNRSYNLLSFIIINYCDNAHLPVRIYPQSSAGKAAFQQYIQSRKKFVKQRTSERLSATNNNDRRQSSLQLDDGLKSYDRVAEWMKEVAACQLDNDKGGIMQARDPIAILQAEAAVNHLQSADTNTQRWYDIHKSKCNNIQKAHRYEFTRLMNKIHQSLMKRLDVSPSDVKASQWQEELTAAVELGRPGDFSSNDICLKVYTVEKLHARCRQLHHLLFNDDEFASKVRSLLLPVPTSDAANDYANDGQERPVNIISIGGGPGYDHVSLCLVAKFLHDIQPHHLLMKMKRRHIRTQVFDLFNESWQPVMISLNECLVECLDDDTINRVDSSSRDHDTTTMTMHHGDLRLGLNDINNTDLAQALEHVDIICIQFCLHENASFIVQDDDHNQPHIRGIMHDIFKHSPMGTTMIITDSINTLFPLLKRTATDYGWRYLGDEEVRKSGKSLAFQGPKNYIMLERCDG